MYEARADTATHRMEDIIREFQSEMGKKVSDRADTTASKLKKTNLGFFDAVTKVLADHMTHMQLLEFKQKLREMHSSEVEVLNQVSAREGRAGRERAVEVGERESARARSRATVWAVSSPRAFRAFSQGWESLRTLGTTRPTR